MSPPPFTVNGCLCRIAVLEDDDGRWVGWVHIDRPAVGAQTVRVDGSFATREEAIQAAERLGIEAAGLPP